MTDRIRQVELGAGGPMVGAQGLGCMGMSEFYGARDDAASLATLHHAVDRGVTLIDTADMYGMGANEELVGRLIKDRRDEVVVATKFGFLRKADDPTYFGVTNRPEHIRAAADASLKRLGLEVIDLYYMHRRDPEVPLADSIGTMAELVEAGKVRHLGLSEVSGDELKEAHAIHPIAALQSEWSLFSRDVEDSQVPAAVELGVGFVAYSPLGRGALTSEPAQDASADPSDIRNYLPRFTGEEGANNAALVDELRAIAARRGVSAAQLALAWVSSRSAKWGLTVVPIPGTRNAGRLDENVAALDVTLSEEELASLETLSGRVKGDAAGMTGVFTFDDFPVGEAMGSVSMTLDAAFVERWRLVYPAEAIEGDTLPPAVSTVVLMHAWRAIVDPKPPGNVHAGQQVAINAPPRLGEAIATEVRCLSKEERKGRKFVRLQTISTGEDGRALFTGETTLIWAV